MDFKSLMAAQIAKSKGPSPSTKTPNTSKYIKRADLEAERQAAYAAEQAKIEAEREERIAKKRKIEDEEVEQTRIREEKKRKLAEESKARREAEAQEEERQRRKRLGLPDLPTQPQNEEGEETDSTLLPEGQEDIADDELRSRLRALHEPISLFNESHHGRLKRYLSLTNPSSQPRLLNTPIPTTISPVPEKDMLLPSTLPPTSTPEHTYLYRQLASYFTLLLTEWSSALSSRSSAVKASSTGKSALNTYNLVLHDLTPLFRQLESRTLEPALLAPICQIVRDAQHRRYVDANDGYLRLSIGKAAWPIGVTMVGIHERSAREKLHESAKGDKLAHIMSDEVTRKFLQSIKRCLSFAQTRWPPEDLGQLMG